MGLTIWYFIRPQPGKIRPVAASRVQDFFFRGGRLPVDDEGRVQYVEVIVHLEDRRAVEVVRLSYFQHRAQPDGTLDRKHLSEIMAAAGETISGGLALPEESARVIRAEHRFAQRRLRNLNRWEPTEVEVDIVRRLINRKAGRELL